MNSPWAPALTVMALAIAIDRLFGEPPNALHPVAWIGKLIARLTALAPRFGPRRQLLAGALIALTVPTLTTLAGLALMRLTGSQRSSRAVAAG